MASFLDIGLLQSFQIIFPFLFVLVVTFAVLLQVKPFKENALYPAVIAVSLAALTLFSPIVLKTINVAAPWFVLLIIGIFFLLIAFYALGYSDDELTKSITGSAEGYGEYTSTIGWWVFSLMLIILIGSLTAVISTEQGFTDLSVENGTSAIKASEGEQSDFFSTITHPKVLGMAVILLIAFLAIGSLSKPSNV